MPKFSDWKIQRATEVQASEFFGLIQNNLAYIKSTFPVTIAACHTLEATSEFLMAAIEKEKKGEGFHFYIRNLESQNLIGYICIKKIDHRILKCELAYFVDEQFARRGVISSALDDILAICFSALGMNKVFICTGLENRGSQRIAIKNKFKLEGILRQEFKNGDGIFEDVNYYGLLKSDYER